MGRFAPAPRALLAAAALLVTAFSLGACAPAQEETTQPEDLAVTDPAADSTFEPVPFPDPGIPGFTFPTPEATILGWAENDDVAQMALHGWGIWAGLTAETDEVYQGQTLRVFETWLTPAQIRDAATAGTSLEELVAAPRDPRPLQDLRQFQVARAQNDETLPDVTGFVKYDPTAAEHAEREQLFSVAALDTMLADGQSGIPGFPVTSIAIKPVFQALDQLPNDGRYYQLAAWPGSPYLIPGYRPASDNCWPNVKDGVTQGFDSASGCWQQCIWIDSQGSGSGPSSPGVDTTCASDGSSRTADSTYPLSSFIHFDQSGSQSVLIGMHVTSREVTRWTWQSFWWSYDPADPKPPSSKAIADARPSQITGAPAHYAHCVGYSMLQPPQPNTGGSNTGESVYCYNPWLEAPFDSSVLPASMPGTFRGAQVANNVGVQTNCMSCHAMAAFGKGNSPDLTQTLYTGDRYVDLRGEQFDGYLTVDFLWSIPGNAK